MNSNRQPSTRPILFLNPSISPNVIYMTCSTAWFMSGRNRRLADMCVKCRPCIQHTRCTSPHNRPRSRCCTEPSYLGSVAGPSHCQCICWCHWRSRCHRVNVRISTGGERRGKPTQKGGTEHPGRVQQTRCSRSRAPVVRGSYSVRQRGRCTGWSNQRPHTRIPKTYFF